MRKWVHICFHRFPGDFTITLNFVLYNISKSYAFFGWMCKWIMPLYYFFPQNSFCNGTLCLPNNLICFCSSNNLNISLVIFKSKNMSKWGCRFIRLVFLDISFLLMSLNIVNFFVALDKRFQMMNSSSSRCSRI